MVKSNSQTSELPKASVSVDFSSYSTEDVKIIFNILKTKSRKKTQYLVNAYKFSLLEREKNEEVDNLLFSFFILQHLKEMLKVNSLEEFKSSLKNESLPAGDLDLDNLSSPKKMMFFFNDDEISQNLFSKLNKLRSKDKVSFITNLILNYCLRGQDSSYVDASAIQFFTSLQNKAKSSISEKEITDVYNLMVVPCKTKFSKYEAVEDISIKTEEELKKALKEELAVKDAFSFF